MTTQRLSARLPERPKAPQWSSSTEITRSNPKSKGAQLRAATLAVDARLKGDKKLVHASRRVSVELARVTCECRSRGIETCSTSCACVVKWKSCGVECECHGSCCNSLVHTPRVGIRSGALGEEFYTKVDLPRGKVAFVVCGRVMSLPEYWRYHEKVTGNPYGNAVRHYGFPILWQGVLPVKYVVDPFEDMTGAVNHSCEPNVVVEACWTNGKIYAVGRTTCNVMAKEALCVDYKWKGTTNPKEFAEICRCREAKCRGLIAEKGSKFMEVSTLHYEGEITRLQEEHAIAEKALQERYGVLAAAEQAGSIGRAEIETELIRKENENEKLKAHIEFIIAAVTRSKASLAEYSIVTEYVVEIPQKEKIHVSPLQKFIQRIRNMFSKRQEEEEEVQAQITISSETNPYFAPDSALLSHRSILPEPSASLSTPRSCPPTVRQRVVPRYLPAP
ncbi:hypothetical protein M758_4G241000 [Ceratodon purpureus]|uniref:SET domain-containing protein n=1 Tax=Ceratodon purpureus TaxID=3225 RepID=A0A8T0IFH6_CERPU|nr:hypothetical protein KC19_4G236700 [Ceratodon purpureus]KAG0620755.1 hypothetical protein M758_4G241000 [Ceratodon purpureus]